MYFSLFKLITYEPDAIHIPCPTCRKLTKEPLSQNCETPINGLTELEIDSSDVELRRRKMSRTNDVVAQRCGVCSFRSRSNEEADFYCTKCALNFCKTCRASHDHHHLFKGHAVIHLSNKETFDLYCDQHEKMLSAYFCTECNVPACTVCVLQDHVDHPTAKLRDALAVRRDHLKTLLNAFGPRLDRLEARCDRLIHRRRSVGCGKAGAGGGDGEDQKVSDDHQQTNEHFGRSTPVESNPVAAAATAGAAKAPKHRRTGFLGFTIGPVIVEAPAPHSLFHQDRRGSPIENDRTTPSPTVAVGSAVRRRKVSGNPAANGLIRAVVNECHEEVDACRCSEAEKDDSFFATLTSQIVRLKKLFNLSTKILEMSQSKKLFAIYDDVAARIQTVIDVELTQLQDDVDRRAQTVSVETRSVGGGRQRDSSGSDVSYKGETSTGATTGDDTSTGGGGGGGGGHDAAESVRPSSPTPMSMLVRPRLLWKVEKQRTDVGELWNPCAAAFLDAARTLVVAEYDNINDRNNKLQLFDVAAGRACGALAQGVIQPLGVATTRDGQHIVVTDCKGKRVKVLAAATGQTILDIGKGQFGWPYGVVVNGRGQVVVTDAFNDTVSIYAVDGSKRLRCFGSSGSLPAQFRNPYHVAVDAREIILVSDSGNNAVKAFDASGQFMFYASEAATRRASMDMFAYSSGTGIERRYVKRRKLKGPRGLTVDPKGSILVADDCSRVCMFDPAGNYIRNLLTEEDSVKYPEAVHCSPSGLLAVTEWNPNNMFAVKMFNLFE